MSTEPSIYDGGDFGEGDQEPTSPDLPPDRVTFQVLLRAMRRIEERVDRLADAQLAQTTAIERQTKSLDSLAVSVSKLAAGVKKDTASRDKGRDR